jgi:hypothetical protein
MVGRVVDDRYLIESLVAHGGMATVYRALDRRLDRQVALKVLHDNLTADADFVSRFVREARSAARLSHPNVVQVFDQGSDGTVLYLAMEYLPGRTLRDVLTGRGALTPRESVSVLEPVLGALAAAHRAGIVHGDVKPENVILTDDGRIKVADFGLARALSAPITNPSSGKLLGTVGYLSPELVSRGVVDARTDVYAAGILLFELLTGKQPFTGDDPLQVAYRHVHETVPAPTSVASRLPVAFDDVVLRATSHDPDGRPPDAGALLAELQAAVGRVPDGQLDVRAADPAALRLDAARTEVFTAMPARPSSVATPAAPAAASQPQPTRVLTVSRREARGGASGGAGGGSMVPRLKVHEDDPERPRGPGDRRRGILTAIAGLVVVLVLIGTGFWWFSSGPGSYLDTPSLTGQRQSDARRELSDLGLSNRVNLVFSTKVAAGQVLSSDPAGGAKVKRNGLVVLTVSKGPERIPVPDVSQMTVHDATAALADAHLKVGETTNEFSAVEPGKVISTSPKSGTKVAPGESVDLVVSKGGGIIKGLQSGRCIDVPGGSQNNGTQVALQDCNGGPSQIWTLGASKQLTVYGITKCLDVANASSDDGAVVQIYDCTGGANQQWAINPDGSIVSLSSGKCLDATNFGTGNGTPIQIWTCGGGVNQKWSRS